MHLPVELAVFVTALVAGAAILDLRTGRLPNALLAVMAGLGLVTRAALDGPFEGALAALAGVAVGLALWLLPFALRWVGGGDVKLVAALGAWLGPSAILRVTLYAGVAGGLLALAYLLVRRPKGVLEAVGVQLASFRATRRFLPEAGASGVRGMPYAVAVFGGLAAELFLFGPWV